MIQTFMSGGRGKIQEFCLIKNLTGTADVPSVDLPPVSRVLIHDADGGTVYVNPRRPARTAAVVLLLLAAAAVMAACVPSPGGRAAGGGDEQPSPPADAPIVVAARAVCRIATGNTDAATAAVRGVDGAPSVVVDGTAYWFFGDTLRAGPGGRDDVIPAAVATSTDTDGSDCVRLRWKQAGGLAQPLFPRRDETTAWPDGVLALDDGSIVFYMVKVHRESPFAWHVQSIGLGRVAPGTTDGSRTVETIWDERTGFPARVSGASSPVRVGDDVVVFLRTDDGANYAAKAPLARLGEAAAYAYWDGERWAARPQDARPLWPVTPGLLPPDNGIAVSYDAAAGRWLAISDGGLADVQVRTAPQPWGPWSAPRTWIDCRPLVEDRYPYCYSVALHRELSADPRTLYVTISSQQPYDVTLLELRLGVAVHEWRTPDGTLRYTTAAPSPDYVDAGVAFYASDIPAPGLDPVYLDGDTYTLDRPAVGGARPAFYAYAGPSTGAVPATPVYRWHRDGREAIDPRARPGWQRGDVAFYVPCAGIDACPP